jgi:hypothetical protein
MALANTSPLKMSPMCSSNCITQDHKSWGECVRAKGLKIAYCGSATNPGNDLTAQKRWDKELDAYASARREGIQPETTKLRDIEKAVRLSDQTGEAYGNTG